MRCALYFGSFNPLHIGHTTIAQYVLSCPGIDRFRFVLSPHNPLKDVSILSDSNERLIQLREAIEKLNAYPPKNSTILSCVKKHFEVSTIEFNLPKPLYTYNTLSYFRQQEPETEFILVIGADNLAIIEKWHKWKELIAEFEVWVYPRIGHNTVELCNKYNVKYLNARQIDISSTEIRSSSTPCLTK